MKKLAVFAGVLFAVASRASAFTMTVTSCSAVAGTYDFTVGNADSPIAMCSIGFVFHGFGPTPTPRVASCIPPTGWSCVLTPEGGVLFGAPTGSCLSGPATVRGVRFTVAGDMGHCLDTTVESRGASGQLLASRQICLACGHVTDVPEIGAPTWFFVKQLYRK